MSDDSELVRDYFLNHRRNKNKLRLIETRVILMNFPATAYISGDSILVLLRDYFTRFREHLDHFPVFTRLSINPAPLPPPTLHSFRQLHSIDVGSFLTDLESSQLISDPPKSLGPLLSALDKHAPIVNKLSRRQSPSNPWFTATLRAFRSTLRYAENIWKRTHSAADWSSFKSLRNQYHKLIFFPKKSTTMTAAIYSLGHGLRTFTAVPRSTQPSTLSGTVK